MIFPRGPLALLPPTGLLVNGTTRARREEKGKKDERGRSNEREISELQFKIRIVEIADLSI